jgi:hypothetical protein
MCPVPVKAGTTEIETILLLSRIGDGIFHYMMNRAPKPYAPRPVDMDSVQRAIERSVASIQRSMSLLSRTSETIATICHERE